jgi:putative endonuclease
MDKRLQNHNAGKVKSTKPYRPYKILYLEMHATKAEAMARERFYKSVDGYRFLKANGII